MNRWVLFFFALACLLTGPLHAQQKSVPAELGGPGFEKIALKQGWQTGRLSEEDMRYIASPYARKGGSIRIAVTDYPATLRAYGKDENSQLTRLIHGLIYEPLLHVNSLTLEILPGLATHWKVEEDGQTFWFRLNPDARFADGMPVTTEDVLATYDLAVDRRILSLATNAFYETYDPPEAVSSYIFKVHTTSLNWKNLLYFGGTEVLPAHILDTINGREYIEKWNYRMPPGSGPYEVREENLVAGQRITLMRNKEWWRATTRQYANQYNFDTISFIVVRDERLELEKFKKGELDLYLIRRAQWYEEEFKFDEVKRGLVQVRRIFTDEPQGVSGLVFNMRKPPFDDPKVREAFGYLFDREGLVKDLMYNAYVMIDSYYPGSVYENPNNPKIRYNPEKAAQLLAEAGYTKRNREGILLHQVTGKPLILSMPITEDAMRIMTPVQQDLKKAGIKLVFEMVDWPMQFMMLNERNFNIAYMNWGATLYPNPQSEYHSDLADRFNTNNLSGFKNARADELMEKEQITFDQGERVKILQELDSLLVASRIYALGWAAPFQRIAYWNAFGQPDFYLDRMSDWRDVVRVWWYDPEKAGLLKQATSDTTLTMPVGERDVRFWDDYKKR